MIHIIFIKRDFVGSGAILAGLFSAELFVILKPDDMGLGKTLQSVV